MKIKDNKFKVGDKVRFKRKKIKPHILNTPGGTVSMSISNEGQFINENQGRVFEITMEVGTKTYLINNSGYWWRESQLEKAENFTDVFNKIEGEKNDKHNNTL